MGRRNALGNVRKIHYLSGGAMLIQNNGSDSLLYAYSDNQGSLLALTDASGNVIEKFAYDPWGARRNPTDWTQKDIRTKWVTNRGYTGHEHIDAFGIINMNGRVYDPLTAMFMSPDPALQSPGDWLNYNRYGYCLNNPFKYTDPSGNYFFWDDLAALFIGGAINWVSNGCMFNAQGLAYFGAGALAGEAMLYAPGAALTISGALGAANSIIGQGFNGDKFDLGRVDFGSVFVSGMTSMITSYAGGTIGGALQLDKVLGNIASPILKNVIGGQIAGTVTGGIFGGVSAGLSGQDILQGAWGGAKMGLVTGTLGGIGSAAQYSLDHNVNIFTGKPNPVMERPVTPEPLPIPKAGVKVTEKPDQVHHFATDKNKQFTPDMKEIADEYKLDLDGDWNKASMPHQGRHPNSYHQFVLNEMRTIRIVSPTQEIFISNFQTNVIRPVMNNPSMLNKSFWKLW